MSRSRNVGFCGWPRCRLSTPISLASFEARRAGDIRSSSPLERRAVGHICRLKSFVMHENVRRNHPAENWVVLAHKNTGKYKLILMSPLELQIYMKSSTLKMALLSEIFQLCDYPWIGNNNCKLKWFQTYCSVFFIKILDILDVSSE